MHACTAVQMHGWISGMTCDTEVFKASEVHSGSKPILIRNTLSPVATGSNPGHGYVAICWLETTHQCLLAAPIYNNTDK